VMYLRTIREMTWMEIKLFLREPFALFFTLFFPVILLLLFGMVYGKLDVGKGYHFIDTYLPALFIMVIANLGLMSIPITLAEYRELGILKYYQVTPVPQTVIMLVQVIVQILMFILSAFLLVVVGKVVFHIRFGGSIFHVGGALLISMAMLYAVGFAIGGLASTVRTAQTAGTAIFFVLFFTSGAAIPRSEFPNWLQEITDWNPMAQAVDMSTGLWMGEPIVQYTKTLLIFVVLFLISVWVVSRKFRWLPS
jgi:ABC-2 type transport system permease protein